MKGQNVYEIRWRTLVAYVSINILYVIFLNILKQYIICVYINRL